MFDNKTLTILGLIILIFLLLTQSALQISLAKDSMKDLNHGLYVNPKSKTNYGTLALIAVLGFLLQAICGEELEYDAELNV